MPLPSPGFLHPPSSSSSLCKQGKHVHGKPHAQSAKTSKGRILLDSSLGPRAQLMAGIPQERLKNKRVSDRHHSWIGVLPKAENTWLQW